MKDTQDAPLVGTQKYSNKLNELQGAWQVTYNHMAQDLGFVSGGAGMWNKDVLNARQGRSRPIVSLSLIQPYVDRIVAPVRVHPPAMAVRTEDRGIESLVNGIVRGIEKASSATDAYANSLKGAVTCGLGWLYLSVDEENGEPVLRIKSTTDPTTMLIDPLCNCIDGRDAQYACYRGYMSKAQAINTWGTDAGESPLERGVGSMMYNVPHNAVLDCIWYELEKDGLRITRTVGIKEVYNQLFEGVSYLPVVPVIGEQLFGTDGRRYGGVVRRARDINESINVTASNMMELVAMAPKSPWVGPAEAFENYKDAWATANTEPHAYLPYKSRDSNNNPLERPQRMDNSPQTQALQSVAEYFMSMLGRVTGVSDAMLGGLETATESGKSLIARMEAAEGATSQYIDHLTTSITQLARVMIQMLPIVYSNERSLVIIDDNGRSARVRGNLSTIMTSDVVEMLDVEVESGPHMELKRKSASEALSQIISVSGEKGIALLDLWADTQDLPNAIAVKDRIKKLLPAELFAEEGEAQELDPQAIEALQAAEEAVAQKDQTIQYLEGLITQLQAQVNSQEYLGQIELRKEEMRTERELAKSKLQAESDMQIELIKQGSLDQRKAIELSSKKDNQILEMEIDMRKENQKVINEAQLKQLDVNVEPTAKLPGYILDDVSEVINND